MSNWNNNFDNINYYQNKKKSHYCSNCGKFGHVYNRCNDPITSYGVILISLDLDKCIVKQTINKLNSKKNISISNKGINACNPFNVQMFCYLRNKIKFLMIRRKHSLGYIEFIRGRYNVRNVDKIIKLFKQMTQEEIDKIGTHMNDFDYLWNDLWKNNNMKHHNEYIKSKERMEKLNSDEVDIKLEYYVENGKPKHLYPEWGFPKGRRNYLENDYDCAIREFKEESGLSNNDFSILNDIEPIHEKLIGSNKTEYKHIYLLGISTSNKKLLIDDNEPSQCNEIGDIAWMTYDQAMKVIRDFHFERQSILTETYTFIINTVIEIMEENK